MHLTMPNMATNSVGIDFEYATATKSMASSSRGSILSFFSGSIPFAIKRMLQRRRGNAARVFSLRIQTMMQHRNEYDIAVEFEIEASKVHWSELDPTSSEEEGNIETDLEIFKSLREKWGDFFCDDGDDFVMGEKIAEGGQAEIFTAQWNPRCGTAQRNSRYGIAQRKSLDCTVTVIMKVFKEGWALRNLQKQWPQGMLKKIDGGGYYSSNSCQIYGGLLLKNGRFAFVMEECWGDLRKLIDCRMQHNYVLGESPQPFTDEVVLHIVLSIAWGMWALHEHNIIHRDLKASNILISDTPIYSSLDYLKSRWSLYTQQLRDIQTLNFSSMRHVKNAPPTFQCVVADFECSVGVVGTGYWRAPEILRAVQDCDLKPHLFTKESDVYSFAMTCYEVITGCIPFEDLGGNCYDIVIEGKRPKLPSYVDPMLKALLKKCWHANPLERLSFKDILEQLKGLEKAHQARVALEQEALKARTLRKELGMK